MPLTNQCQNRCDCRLRLALAFLRLICLYGILCWGVVAAGLQWRAWRESGRESGREFGPDLNQPPISTTNPAAAIPLLGITVELEGQSAASREIALKRLGAAGFGWVRQRFDWGQIEPQPGHFDWTASDAWVEAIAQSGLIPVTVLDGSPAWARRPEDRVPDNRFSPPSNPRDFARFAEHFAERYGDQVRFYQIWHEPNIAPHWGNRVIEPVEYAHLLIAASRAIRHADPAPDTAILSAALAPTQDQGHLAIDEIYFFQRMIAAGAAAYFDALAIQPFGFGRSVADSRQSIDVLNFQRAALIRRAMIAAGIGDKPIWAARFGWNTRLDSRWATVSPVDQQRFMRQAIELVRNDWPWLTALGWAIDQPNAARSDPVWGFVLDEGGWEGRQEEGETGGLGDWGIGGLGWLIGLGLLIWRAVAAIRIVRGWDWRRSEGPSGSVDGITRWRIFEGLAWATVLLVYHFATWPPLIGLCWLVAMTLIEMRPQVGLWLAAVSLPLYFQHKELYLVDQMWVISPALAATLCLVPSVVRGAWRVRNPQSAIHNPQFPPSPSPLDLLALAWLLINGLAAANVWQWVAYERGWIELVLQPLLLYWAVRLLIRDEKQVRWLMMAMSMGGLLVAVWGGVDWVGGGGTNVDGLRRLVGPYYSPNHAALLLVRTLFLTIGVAIFDTQRRSWWWLIATVISIGLLLTASRGALLLGVPVGGFMMLQWVGVDWVKRVYVRYRWILQVAALLIVLLLAVGIFWGWDRLVNSNTLHSRLILWQAAVDLWRAVPWLGVGPNGFFWNYPAYLASAEPVRFNLVRFNLVRFNLVEFNLVHPHNLWLEFASSWGLLGLSWLLLLLMTLWRFVRARGKSSRNWLEIGMWAALAAALAHAQVDTFMALPDLAAWNWIVLGLIASFNSLGTKTA